MEDVGGHDAGMQRSPEGIETRETELAAYHRLMGESAARAAVLLGDRRAKQPCCAGLGPDLAVVHAALIPAVEIRRIFGRNEAARLPLEQNDVLAHPACRRNVENAHVCSNSHTGRTNANTARPRAGLNRLFTSSGKNCPPRQD